MIRHPQLLYLLFLPVILVPLMIAGYHQGLKTLQTFFGRWRADILKETYVVKYFFAGLGVFIALLALILSLLGFQGKKRIEIAEHQGTDIVFVMDVSRSMLCEDVEPSRLGKAVDLAAGIIERNPGARFAVVIFKGEGVKTIPLTEDIKAVTGFLDILNPSLLSAPGSNIESAIHRALESFTDREQRRKIIVLFSDGEALSGDLDAAAVKAVEAEVLVLSVGTGTKEGGRIPLEGGTYVTDSGGKEVITRLHQDTLEELALKTSGMYLPVSDPVFFTRISDVTEGKGSLPEFKTRDADAYRSFLLVALGGFCIFLLARIRRWKNIS